MKISQVNKQNYHPQFKANIEVDLDIQNDFWKEVQPSR